jgi:hypothetical protein
MLNALPLLCHRILRERHVNQVIDDFFIPKVGLIFVSSKCVTLYFSTQFSFVCLGGFS